MFVLPPPFLTMLRTRLNSACAVALFVLACLGSPRAQAQVPADLAVQVSATVQATPTPQIQLSWPVDANATSYQVYRKGRDDTSWGSPIASPPSNATGYTDTNVAVGQTYEYQIIRRDPNYFEATGYIYSGINVPLTDSRGTVILIVDNTMSTPLAQELARLQLDLIGDGWTVVRHDVGRDQNLTADYPGAPPPVREPADHGTGAQALKALIVADDSADPTKVKAVFLFGHVPIAFSGDLNPDAHPDHEGAWPADVYYGDVGGTWTDTQNFPGTYNTKASVNTAGDGSFDQTTIPAPVTLAVGRVDLYAMTAYAPKTETDLLRQYLNKDHAFRVGQMTAQRRGLTDSGFGYRGFGDTFGDNAYRNFAPFFGASNITDISANSTSWLPTLDTNSYLWAEADAAGAPDGFAAIANVGHGDGYVVDFGAATDDYALHTPKAVFNMTFGSYFGDWTFGSYYQQTTFGGLGSSNNLLRAPLANGYGLTNVWAGRPDWFFHHMALGETIGFSTLITQNNGFSNLYLPQNIGTGEIHVALMGDPTLRMHTVAPATHLTAPITGSAQVQWTASTDPAVVGYHVYRALVGTTAFTRLTLAPVAGITYFDATATPTSYDYMVRAVKLETSGSGTYFNPSQGAFIALTVTPLHLSGLSVAPTAVTGGVAATGTVTLNQPAPSGGITVTLSSSDPSASVPGTVTVPEGGTTATFPVATQPVGTNETVTLTATYQGASQTAMLTIQTLAVTSLAFSPPGVVSGNSATGTVTLSNPASPGGVTVSLSSDNPAVPMPATVTVKSGDTTATFTVMAGTVSAQTTGNVTAGINGTSQMATLTVLPVRVSGLTLAPATLFGGNSSIATVTLNGPAPAGGATVALSSCDPAASVPGTVTVAQGGTTATFPVTTQVIAAATTASISASYQGASQAAALTIQPYVVTGLSLSPTSVLAGSPATGTVTLSALAPPGGLPVSLSSDSPAASFTPTVLVPAGQTTATFPMTTQTVPSATTANITAALPGGARSAVLTINPNGLASLTFAPASVGGGALVTGTVTLNGPAQAGGVAVSLTSAAPDLAPVPATVTVPAGRAVASFTFIAGATVGTATAKVTAAEGGTAQSATLTVQGVTLLSLAFAPAQVRGGQGALGMLTLSGPAPSGGALIALSSPSAAVIVPATVTVLGGAATASFTAATSAVSAATTVTVAATVGGTSASGALTVTPVPGTVFGPGIRMISVPMDYPGVPVDQLLGAGVRLYRWVPSAITYAVLPNPPADSLRLGRGYWVRLGSGATVTRLGTPADPTQDFPIPLEKGWNQIGDPFFVNVPLSGVRVSSGGQSRSLSAATNVIDSPLYVYNPGGAGTLGQYLPAGSLDAGQGYWIHATAAATLVVPHP